MEKIKRIQAGNIVHDYFGRANPEFEEIDGGLWVEVDYTVGRDMNDCFERGEPVIIDGVKYMIREMPVAQRGLRWSFLIESGLTPTTVLPFINSHSPSAALGLSDLCDALHTIQCRCGA